MRVCIIRNAEARTNASLLRVMDALISDHHECILLTRSRYDKASEIVQEELIWGEQKIENHVIKMEAVPGRGLKNIFDLLRYQYLLFKWLFKNKNKFDWIHAYDLDAGWPVKLFSKLYHKPYIYHIADFYVDSRGGIPGFLKKSVRKMEYSVIKKAKATIICTEKRTEQIQGSHPQKLEIIYNVPGLSRLPEKKKKISQDGRLSFVYVGALSEKRFIRHILNIFSRHPNAELILAGMGPLEDLVADYAAQFPNIDFLGRIDYEKALELYAEKCDVMFAIYDPSVDNHRFCAPNKVYEAMFLGKPIIVAENSGIDDIVTKEKMGCVIPYQEKSFEKTLEYLEQHPEEIEKMGQSAQKAYENYSWEKMKRKLIGLYREIA